jgi:hypothetical protein
VLQEVSSSAIQVTGLSASLSTRTSTSSASGTPTKLGLGERIRKALPLQIGGSSCRRYTCLGQLLYIDNESVTEHAALLSGQAPALYACCSAGAGTVPWGQLVAVVPSSALQNTGSGLCSDYESQPAPQARAPGSVCTPTHPCSCGSCGAFGRDLERPSHTPCIRICSHDADCGGQHRRRCVFLAFQNVSRAGRCCSGSSTTAGNSGG